MADPNAGIAARAAAERALPSICGAIAGMGAAVAAPPSAGSGFFSAAAQVVPVLLLALAIEAGQFGLGKAVLPDDERLARGIMSLRRALLVAGVVVLVLAEWRALVALERPGRSDPSLVYLGLAWGFVMVAGLALIGADRTRVAVGLKSTVIDSAAILEISLDSRYATKLIDPLFNLLVPTGHGLATCEEDGGNAKAVETFSVSEKVGGKSGFVYHSKTVQLAPGNVYFGHYRIEHAGKDLFPVVVQLHHENLPGGFVEREGEIQVPKTLSPASPSPGRI
jgi:hypothetical protein